MLESIFGHPDPDCWTPLTLSTLFSEGWREPWVPSPNGSGGAPRQGWINAADGNLYRLNFFTFAQGFNNPPQGNAYLGGYTLYTPFSRRLLLITNVPFVLRNNASNGLPTIDPHRSRRHAEPNDIRRHLVYSASLATRDARFFTHRRNDGADANRQRPVAGKSALIPKVAFWYNIAGGWVIRGGIGDYISTNGDGTNNLISQLAIGQTLTGS